MTHLRPSGLGLPSGRSHPVNESVLHLGKIMSEWRMCGMTDPLARSKAQLRGRTAHRRHLR
jgi:hypothetical protein